MQFPATRHVVWDFGQAAESSPRHCHRRRRRRRRRRRHRRHRRRYRRKMNAFQSAIDRELQREDSRQRQLEAEHDRCAGRAQCLLRQGQRELAARGGMPPGASVPRPVAKQRCPPTPPLPLFAVALTHSFSWVLQLLVLFDVAEQPRPTSCGNASRPAGPRPGRLCGRWGMRRG